jgi:hypothetical protein
LPFNPLREDFKMKLSNTWRCCFLLAGLAGGISGQMGAAGAAEPDLRASSALMRLALPYSPYVFDLSVQAARSLAEVTYGQRSYDPLTGSFVASDLEIRRDALDVHIRRLRIGEAVIMLEGVAVRTEGLPLPPELREGLRKLDRETIVGDLVMTLKRDDARSALALDIALDMDGIGAISAQGAVDNFHVLVPLDEMDSNFSEEPTVSGFLTNASVAYRDAGLAATVNEILAQQQGVSPDDMRNGIAVLPVGAVGDILNSLPGGASPALRDQAMAWARVVEAFIREPDAIRVSVAPKEPFPLSALQQGMLDEALIAALDPDVVAGAAAGKPAVAPPAGPVEAAAAQVLGDAVVQDREAGARALLALAGKGDTEAVAKIALLFGDGRQPDLQPAELADLYRFLLVGRALGQPVSDAVLAALAGSFDAGAARGAEISAAAFFRENTEEGRALAPLSSTTIGDYDTGGLRARAFDAYEGRGVTRDLTEAYAVALVAAAAGDELAAGLRDTLANAAREKRVVVSVDEAKARAADLWAAYSAGRQ